LACDALENDLRVVFGYLFGGYARGNPTPLSDGDIALYLDGVADIAAAKGQLRSCATQNWC
jgi:predicted nucleotidyltransferase